MLNDSGKCQRSQFLTSHKILAINGKQTFMHNNSSIGLCNGWDGTPPSWPWTSFSLHSWRSILSLIKFVFGICSQEDNVITSLKLSYVYSTYQRPFSSWIRIFWLPIDTLPPFVLQENIWQWLMQVLLLPQFPPITQQTVLKHWKELKPLKSTT